jgi:hypothetical protein
LRWQHRTAGAKAVGTVAADAHGAAATVAADAHGAAVTGVAAHGVAATTGAGTGVAVIGAAAIRTTGMAETGAVAIGVAATGAVEIGVAETGTTGIMTTISFSLVASDFRGGGAGAIRMDIMEATHMVMVTGLATAMEVTHMVTVMALVTVMGLATAMAMEATNMVATAMEMDTATATGAAPELPSYSAGSLALVTITDPSTASWDHRRVKQFGPTSRTAAVNPVLSTARNARESDRKKAQRDFIWFLKEAWLTSS